MNEKKANLKLSIKDLAKRYGIVIAFLLLVIFFSIASPRFLSGNNILNLLRQISVRGILSIGMMFVILGCGIDLSIDNNVTLCGIIIALLLKSGVGVFIAMLAGVLCGAVIGSANGYFVAYRRMPAFIVTMATNMIMKGVLLVITDGKPISNLPEEYCAIGRNYALGVPVLVWFMIGVFILAFFLLNFTVFGRRLYAVGGNKKAARVSGINATLIEALTYTFCGGMCGLASGLLTSRVASATSTAGQGMESLAIAACVIGGVSFSGGKGTVFGAIIGILLIGVINNGMDIIRVNSYYQNIVMGAIILVAVLIDMLSNKES